MSDQKDNRNGYLVFSNDQEVEEAKELEKTVNSSLPSIGIKFENKVVLASATKSYQSNLMEKDNLSEVLDLGGRAGMVSAGRLADAQSLAEKMRDRAVQDIEEFGQLEDVNVLVKEVAEDVREARQEIPYRSYGVSMIVGGINGNQKAELYRVGVGGVLTSWTAVAIGSNKDKILDELEDRYGEIESFEQAISTATELLLKYSDATEEGLSVGTIKPEYGLETLNMTQLNTYITNTGDQE